MERAKALIYAAVEDFGIVPVEAQACCTPVIAYGKGGVLETVIDGITGIFFSEQTVSSIIEAVNRFEEEKIYFEPNELIWNAQRFKKERFQDEIRRHVESCWSDFKKGMNGGYVPGGQRN